MSVNNVDVLLQTDNAKDRLFTMWSLLKENLVAIAKRKNSGLKYRGSLPDFEDVKTTHHVFVSAEYKPFIPIAFLYSVASKKSGELAYNKDITFVTQYSGSFIGDMFMVVNLSQSSSADAALPNSVPRDMIRYCALPGARLVTKCDLLFGGTPANSFSRMNMIHYMHHELNPTKLPNFYKMLGQEQTYIGELTPRPGYTEYRSLKSYGIGAQTFKVTQEPLKLFYPIIFWFNTNSQEVLVNRVSDSISIRVTLDKVTNIVEKVGTGSNGAITYPVIESAELYCKDIYVPKEIHDMYIMTKRYQVISTWRSQNFDLVKSSDSNLLNARDWPIERMYMSYIPASTDSNFQHWYKGFVMNPVDIPEFTVALDTTPVPPATYYLDTLLARVYTELLSTKKINIKTTSLVYYDNIDTSVFTDYSTDFNDNLHHGNIGSLVVPFDYKPNTKSITSGYSSTSNNADFNITYTSDHFSSVNTGVLHVSAKILDTMLVNIKLLEVRFNI